jgi:hypothetical protein
LVRLALSCMGDFLPSHRGKSPGKEHTMSEKNDKSVVGKGVQIEVEGSLLTIKVDLSKKHGLSSSGKSEIIASSMGNVEIAPGVKMGLNIYTKK